MFYGIEIIYIKQKNTRFIKSFKEKHEAISFKDNYVDENYCDDDGIQNENCYLKNTSDPNIWEFYEKIKEINWIFPNKKKDKLRYKIKIFDIHEPVGNGTLDY
jgi:hypothetical protein